MSNYSSAKNAKHHGQQVLRDEAKSLLVAADRLSDSFSKCVDLILKCTGRVVVTGLGKSGHVGAKIASTLASTGTPAFFLHPSEALHGDFGVIMKDDCILALTYGGVTREVLAVAKYGRANELKVIALVGNVNSALAHLADAVLDGSVEKEADSLDLAPTSSSTLSLALGDALAVALMHARQFTRDHFAQLHPGGELGRRLALVVEHMHPVSQMGHLVLDSTFHDALKAVTANNFGVAAVLSPLGKLEGCVTDGDIRRLLIERGSEALGARTEDLMTISPKTIGADKRVMDAIAIMEQHSITSLFVVEKHSGAVMGLLRLHDLLAAKVI